MFFIVVGIIAIISVLWALLSLRDFRKKTQIAKDINQELQKGRVLFDSQVQDDSSTSSEVSSSLPS